MPSNDSDDDMTKKMAGMFAAGLLIGGGLVWVVFSGSVAEAPTEMEEQQMTDTGTGSMTDEDMVVKTTLGTRDTIDVSDQAAGSAVHVARVSLNEDAWLVVHELWPDGALGNALGAALVLVDARDATVELLRGTTPGKKYMVLVYNDNGDRAFDLDTDTKERDAEGALVGAAFFALSSGVDGR